MNSQNKSGDQNNCSQYHKGPTRPLLKIYEVYNA